MGNWVDDPDITDDIGVRLVDILVWKVATPPEIMEVVEAVGLAVGKHPFGAHATASILWPSVLKDAAQSKVLRSTIEVVMARTPETVGDLRQILDAERPGGTTIWYRSSSRDQALLIGPGARRAMIDREPLRAALVRVIGAAGSPVLAIKGEPGLGKSYSRNLIQHVIDGAQPSWQLITIDIAELWPEDEVENVNARTFIEMVSSKLGLDRDYGEVPEYTEPKRIARELVMELSGRFKSLEEKHRILFVDGADRTNVGHDVGVAIAHIANEVDRSEVGKSRLIVTGYDGSFATSVEEVLERDRVVPFTESHIRLFYERIGNQVDQVVTADDLNQLVSRTLEQTSFDDLRSVGRQASRIAHEHFGKQ